MTTVINLLRPAAIQMLRNIFTQTELYLRGTVSDTVVTASSVNAFRKQLSTVNLEKFVIVG